MDSRCSQTAYFQAFSSDCAFYVLLKRRSQAALLCHLQADWMCLAVVFCSCVGCLKMWGWVSCLRQRVGDYFIASRRLPPPGTLWEDQGPFPANPPITASHLLTSHLWHGLPSNQKSEEASLSSSSGSGPSDLLQPASWCRPFRHVSSCKLEDRRRERAVNTQKDVPVVLLQPVPQACQDLGWVVHFGCIFFYLCAHPFTHTFIWA